MDAVILTAIQSAGKSWLYAYTRMLYAMGHVGKAPKVLAAPAHAASPPSHCWPPPLWGSLDSCRPSSGRAPHTPGC